MVRATTNLVESFGLSQALQRCVRKSPNPIGLRHNSNSQEAARPIPGSANLMFAPPMSSPQTLGCAVLARFTRAPQNLKKSVPNGLPLHGQFPSAFAII
jgi:hypothetical protein